jgi:hypothetical protein
MERKQIIAALTQRRAPAMVPAERSAQPELLVQGLVPHHRTAPEHIESCAPMNQVPK